MSHISGDITQIINVFSYLFLFFKFYYFKWRNVLAFNRNFEVSDEQSCVFIQWAAISIALVNLRNHDINEIIEALITFRLLY